jgi:hypothetical protein
MFGNWGGFGFVRGEEKSYVSPVMGDIRYPNRGDLAQPGAKKKTAYHPVQGISGIYR